MIGYMKIMIYGGLKTIKIIKLNNDWVLQLKSYNYNSSLGKTVCSEILNDLWQVWEHLRIVSFGEKMA